jgi:hypothetical protein
MTHVRDSTPPEIWMPTYDLQKPNEVEPLLQQLRSHISRAVQPSVDAAFRLAERVHRGQLRKTSGDVPVPYITHPLRVALILVQEWECAERETIVTALLHDVIEDCAFPESREHLTQEIRLAFGNEIERAIWTLTKPEPGPTEVRYARDARYFSEIRKASEWVRLIKCADRVDNLRDATAWGDRDFWSRYSSETIGWHLFLARETAPIAEVALFQALVEGERTVRGRFPIWVDGHIVDPTAAARIPEHIARHYGVVGLALQGETLYVGMRDVADAAVLRDLALVTRQRILPVLLSQDALQDALDAGLYSPL